MAKSPLKVGLIGVGKMGQNHLRVLSLLKSASLEFIYDTDGARLAAAAARFGARVSRDPDADLANVDAAIICTPTATHLEWIKRAGKHVQSIFVEKPLTSSLAEETEASEFIRKHKLKVQVGFIERFNPVVQELARILKSEESAVINVDFTRTNSLSKRIVDVDVITDLMIHDIDLALHLNGPVKRVFASGLADDSLVSFATATLWHENGSYSRLMASRVTEKKMRTIQATCRRIFIDCELFRKEIVINRQSNAHHDTNHYTIASTQETVEVPPQEALLNELQAFIAYSKGEAVEVPTVECAMSAMRICDEIQAAVRGQS